MKYINANLEKPKSGVDVFVVTTSGTKAIASFWGMTGKWLTMDKNIKHNDTIKKWKYADAT